MGRLMRLFFQRKVIATGVFFGLSLLLYKILQPLPQFWIPEEEIIPDNCFSPNGRLLATIASVGTNGADWSRPESEIRIRNAVNGNILFTFGPLDSTRP